VEGDKGQNEQDQKQQKNVALQVSMTLFFSSKDKDERLTISSRSKCIRPDKQFSSRPKRAALFPVDVILLLEEENSVSPFQHGLASSITSIFLPCFLEFFSAQVPNGNEFIEVI